MKDIPPMQCPGDIEHMRLRVINGFLHRLVENLVLMGFPDAVRRVQAILDPCMVDGDRQPGLSNEV